jgi:hypothetical protein
MIGLRCSFYATVLLALDLKRQATLCGDQKSQYERLENDDVASYVQKRASFPRPHSPQPEVPKAPASPSWGFLLFQAQRKSPAPPMGRAFSRRLGYPQAPIPPLNRANQNRLIGNPERRAGLGRQLGQIKFGPCVTQKPQIAVERLRDGLFPPHHRFPPWSRKPQGDRPRVCPGASLTFRP